MSNMEIDYVTSTSISSSPLAAVLGARQRATRLLDSQAADTPGSQLRRHQKSRGRCPDRARDFRQEPRRTCGGRRALDRVLLWNHYVVPQFTDDKVSAARWDRFGRPIRCRVWRRGISNGLGVGSERAANEGSWYRITSATSYVLCLIALLFLPETRGKPLTGWSFTISIAPSGRRARRSVLVLAITANPKPSPGAELWLRPVIYLSYSPDQRQ